MTLISSPYFFQTLTVNNFQNVQYFLTKFYSGILGYANNISAKFYKKMGSFFLYSGCPNLVPKIRIQKNSFLPKLWNSITHSFLNIFGCLKSSILCTQSQKHYRIIKFYKINI